MVNFGYYRLPGAGALDNDNPLAILSHLDCSTLTSPSFANFSFSLLILLGILVSYLPQHHRIISRKTSEGISPWFLLLGVTSGTCTFVNISILSREVVGCCYARSIGGFECLAATLGVVQVGMQWVCFAVILALFLIYFPRESPPPKPVTIPLPSDPSHHLHLNHHTISSTSSSSRPPSLKEPTPFSSRHPTPTTALLVFLLCLTHFLITIAVIPIFFSSSPNKLTLYANFLGLQATLLASVQYIPQIYTTYKLSHVGSLSIPMMCIQTPGSFVWAVSLAAREGTGWSSWITYVVTGCLQGMLLIMCVGFEVRDRRERKRLEEEEERRKMVGDGVAVNGRYGTARTGTIESTEEAGSSDETQPLLSRR